MASCNNCLSLVDRLWDSTLPTSTYHCWYISLSPGASLPKATLHLWVHLALTAVHIMMPYGVCSDPLGLSVMSLDGSCLRTSTSASPHLVLMRSMHVPSTLHDFVAW